MQGTENSVNCLADDECDPLGGHSVWAAFPDYHAVESAVKLPIILVAAQLDGIGFFHEDIVGADAPLSGLIAVLATAEILGNAADLAAYRSRLVFAAFAGEPWGYMGSKRFLWELSGKTGTDGLFRLPDIAQVIEVGQVGRAPNVTEESHQLFFHSQQGPEFGSAAGIWEALREASVGSTASLSKADPRNGGIPPSSLASFLLANASLAGAVLTEFDSNFTNPGYATAEDTLEGINAAGIVAAAALLARGLHRLSTGSQELQVDFGQTRQTVDSLLECFATKGAILACEKAQKLIARAGMPSNYVGVLHTLTADEQEPDVYVKNDMSRFLWNFLAEATSSGAAKLASGESGGCDPEKNVCEDGAACVGFRVDRPPPEGNGQCVFATARFVPAYSTQIECQGCSSSVYGKWVPSTATAEWESSLGWPEDPIWTESRWPVGVPSIELFLKEDARRERAVLTAGITITVLAVLASQVARVLHARRVEQG